MPTQSQHLAVQRGVPEYARRKGPAQHMAEGPSLAAKHRSASNHWASHRDVSLPGEPALIFGTNTATLQALARPASTPASIPTGFAPMHNKDASNAPTVGGVFATTAAWSQMTGWMERQEQLLQLLRREHLEQQEQLRQKINVFLSHQESFMRAQSVSSRTSAVSSKCGAPPRPQVDKEPRLADLPNAMDTIELPCIEVDDLPSQADLHVNDGFKSALVSTEYHHVGQAPRETTKSTGPRLTLDREETDNAMSGTQSVLSATVPTPKSPARGRKSSRDKGRSRLSRVDSARRSALRKRGDVKTNALMDEYVDAEDNRVAPPFLRRLVDHPSFDFVTGLILIANVVGIGYEVEYKAKNVIDTSPPAMDLLEYLFAFLFTVELVLRIAADGYKKYFITGDVNWNWLDFCIVMATLLEMGFRTIFGEAGTFDNATVLRAVRLIRIVRVMRVIRVMKFFKSLRLLIAAVMHTVKTCVWTVMLLAIVLYTFGIVFTQAATEEVIGEFQDAADAQGASIKDYVGSFAKNTNEWNLRHRYGGLHETMLTLYMSTTGGLDWDQALEPMMFSLVYEFLFLGFISFVFFAVLNVVTAIFCQFAIEIARADSADIIKEQLEQKAVFIDSLKKLFHDWGAEDNEEISLNQFEAHLDDEHMKAFLKHIGIDSDDAWSLFNLLDRDKGGSIDIDEFVDGCLRLRGPAMTIQIAKLEYEQKFFGDTLADMIEEVGLQVGSISTELSAVAGAVVKLQRKVDHIERRSPAQALFPQQAQGVSRRARPAPGLNSGNCVLGGIPDTMETGSELHSTLTSALTWEPGLPVEV